MSRYNICFEKVITSAIGRAYEDLDPVEFIYCENEEMLRDEIIAFFYNSVYYDGDIRVYESTTSVDIPEKFLEEWRELKQKK